MTETSARGRSAVCGKWPTPARRSSSSSPASCRTCASVPSTPGGRSPGWARTCTRLAGRYDGRLWPGWGRRLVSAGRRPRTTWRCGRWRRDGRCGSWCRECRVRPTPGGWGRAGQGVRRPGSDDISHVMRAVIVCYLHVFTHDTCKRVQTCACTQACSHAYKSLSRARVHSSNHPTTHAPTYSRTHARIGKSELTHMYKHVNIDEQI